MGKYHFKFLTQTILDKIFETNASFFLLVSIYFVQDCLREKLDRENGKKTMSKCHIPERSHVTKPLLLSNDVVISPIEHAQQNCQINQF